MSEIAKQSRRLRALSDNLLDLSLAIAERRGTTFTEYVTYGRQASYAGESLLR